MYIHVAWKFLVKSAQLVIGEDYDSRMYTVNLLKLHSMSDELSSRSGIGLLSKYIYKAADLLL